MMAQRCLTAHNTFSLLLAALLLTSATCAKSKSFLRSTSRQPFTSLPCGRSCRFRLCRLRQDILFPAPGVFTFPGICRRNQDIGQILSVGEALVAIPGAGEIPISSWEPQGLSDKFRADYFETGMIPGEDNSGLTRKEVLGNQNEIIDGVCFVLPITSYQRLKNGRLVTINKRSPRDCLAFLADTHDLVIEAQWLSGDDMDLAVIEPDNSFVSFRNRNGVCGRLASDVNVDTCDLRGEGFERITYSLSCATLQRGTYRAVLSHATNCGERPSGTEYTLRIVRNGNVDIEVTGVSNNDAGAVVSEVPFVV